MNNNYATFILIQIYDFLKERPEFLNQSESARIVEYFQELHKGKKEEFSFNYPSKISGNFGIQNSINIQQAPRFSDKKSFIQWVTQQLHHESTEHDRYATSS